MTNVKGAGLQMMKGNKKMNSLSSFKKHEETKDKLVLLMQTNGVDPRNIPDSFLDTCAYKVKDIIDLVLDKYMGEEEIEIAENNDEFPFMNLIFGLMDVVSLYVIKSEMDEVKIKKMMEDRDE